MDFSKGKVASLSHEHILEEEKILQDNISGQEDIMSQQLGRDEAMIREYISYQEAEDQRIN